MICTGTRENGGMTGAFFPLPFQKGGNGGGGAFSKQYHRQFMAYQDRLQTNLLQLFGHPENSE